MLNLMTTADIESAKSRPNFQQRVAEICDWNDCAFSREIEAIRKKIALTVKRIRQQTPGTPEYIALRKQEDQFESMMYDMIKLVKDAVLQD